MSYLDKPETDNTTAAHPAYWRGKHAGMRDIMEIVGFIVRGIDDGSGVNNHPEVELMRRDLLAWREIVEKYNDQTKTKKA
jgi:hypothetical protein